MTLQEPSAGFDTLTDLRAAAEKRVPPEVWAYVEGGAGEEFTVRDNRAAFRRWSLRPRALAGISAVDLRTTFLRNPVASPVFLAPTAYHGLVCASGEVATAAAAAKSGVLPVFSTLTSCSLEEIAEASGGSSRWFQLYLQPEYKESRGLIQRAEKAGYRAIVLTVDAPVLGPRDRQTRDGVAIRSQVPIGNGPRIVPPARAPEFKNGVFEFPTDATATWEVLGRLRKETRLPFAVKGLLTAEDACLAVDAGAEAVIVSNHGGRQLDHAAASLDVLPEIVAAVGHRAEVYLDGGVRRGSDVLTALALGARGVGIGRPVLWALAAGGAAGVDRLLSLLNREIAVTMMLAGCRTVAEVDKKLLTPRGH